MTIAQKVALLAKWVAMAMDYGIWQNVFGS